MSTEPPIPTEPGQPSPNPGPHTAPEPATPEHAPDPSPSPAADPPQVGDEPRAFSPARTPNPPMDRSHVAKMKDVPLYGDMWGTGAVPRPYDMPGLAPDYPEPQAPSNALLGPKPGPGQFSMGQSSGEQGANPSEPPPSSTKP
jgi:hypothetical protein